MSRRMRAGILFLLAALAGLGGTAIVGNQSPDSAAIYGDLRPVVVTSGELAGRVTITPKLAKRRLRVVRVPARFVPTGALTDPAQAVDLQPHGPLPAGLYLSAGLLRLPGQAGNSGPRLARRLRDGRQPVEIAVSSASAPFIRGSREVDVVVTSETGPGRQGRTYLAARGVPLIDLLPAPGGAAAGRATAVLALKRPQALALIRAETYARDIRLLPRDPA